MNRAPVFLLLACFSLLVSIVESMPAHVLYPVTRTILFSQSGSEASGGNTPQEGSYTIGIKGHVTSEADGSSLAGIEVKIYRIQGTGYTDTWTTVTDGDGRYHFDGLESDVSFKMSFSDQSNDYLTEFFIDKPDFKSADIFRVMSGTPTIDAALAESATITGRVTARSDGSPLQDIRVDVSEIPYTAELFHAFTGANGVYHIKGLRTGSYQLSFTDYSDTYADEYYKNAYDAESAEEIPISAGTTTTIDARLLTAGGIKGHVAGEDGQNLKWIKARAYYWYKENWITNWDFWVYTDRDGRYELLGKPPGIYRIFFSPDSLKWPDGTYIPEYYDDVLEFDNAADVRVREGKITRGIDAVLGSQAPPTITPNPTPTASTTATRKPKPTVTPKATANPTTDATSTKSPKPTASSEATSSPEATAASTTTPEPAATPTRLPFVYLLPVVTR